MARPRNKEKDTAFVLLVLQIAYNSVYESSGDLHNRRFKTFQYPMREIKLLGGQYIEVWNKIFIKFQPGGRWKNKETNQWEHHDTVWLLSRDAAQVLNHINLVQIESGKLPSVPELMDKLVWITSQEYVRGAPLLYGGKPKISKHGKIEIVMREKKRFYSKEQAADFRKQVKEIKKTLLQN